MLVVADRHLGAAPRRGLLRGVARHRRAAHAGRLRPRADLRPAARLVRARTAVGPAAALRDQADPGAVPRGLCDARRRGRAGRACPTCPTRTSCSATACINAAASGHGFRRFVFINSDLLEVGGAASEPDALRFVIAHEVGHIAAGHVSYWRILGTFASQWIPLVGSTLSRAQEYTADNYGHALAPQGARSAMATLAGGKYLSRSVDVDAMADRAVTEPGFFVWVTNAVGQPPGAAVAHARAARPAASRTPALAPQRAVALGPACRAGRLLPARDGRLQPRSVPRSGRDGCRAAGRRPVSRGARSPRG